MVPPLRLRVETYDVFASKPFQGNQLAVFSGEDVARAPMQALAREMNYAESTFVLPGEGEKRRFRIFTCEKELPFAGHPTLGTAYHVLRDLEGNSVELECEAGAVRVTREDSGLLWMRQLPPTFGPLLSTAELSTALGCDEEALDKTFPAQVVSTGTPFAIVALRSLRALEELSRSGAPLGFLCKTRGVVGIYCVAMGGRDDSHTVSARSFVDEVTVPEDPATGSACGCFAAWSVRTGFLQSPATAVVGQGFEMGRPSLLHVRVGGGGDSDICVQVGGRVVPVLTGATVCCDT
ncbi:hypothetical protein CTAYLR_001838 [Chrysophaeum taylorii]|uniref:PhzF family phenazine biosynthesis protein n=1 Tax=Chrysophaeum taylorii TaxID=2483200 RepID=A0AAD7XIW1_9STRA|nr:hypothetical protein CTAYLR_001838 [Chrysophaeum taylorii]